MQILLKTHENVGICPACPGHPRSSMATGIQEPLHATDDRQCSMKQERQWFEHWGRGYWFENWGRGS